jgi:hypothetical protein
LQLALEAGDLQVDLLHSHPRPQTAA